MMIAGRRATGEGAWRARGPAPPAFVVRRRPARTWRGWGAGVGQGGQGVGVGRDPVSLALQEAFHKVGAGGPRRDIQDLLATAPGCRKGAPRRGLGGDASSGGLEKLESAADPRRRFRIDPSAVRLHDGVQDGQAQARAFPDRRVVKKGSKMLTRRGLVHARSVVPAAHVRRSGRPAALRVPHRPAARRDGPVP